MKKTLLTSFFIFWVLTTAMATFTLLKWGNKTANSLTVNQEREQYALKGQLPVSGDKSAASFNEESDSNSGSQAENTATPNTGKNAKQSLSIQPSTKIKSGKVAAASFNSQAAQNIQPINNQLSQNSPGITSAAVAAHKTANDCWSIIDGSVYNLTSLVSAHSGGAAAIIGACGKDGTALFNSRSHSTSANNTLSAYYIGDLAAGEFVVPAIQPAPAFAVTPSQSVIVPVPDSSALTQEPTEDYSLKSDDEEDDDGGGDEDYESSEDEDD